MTVLWVGGCSARRPAADDLLDLILRDERVDELDRGLLFITAHLLETAEALEQTKVADLLRFIALRVAEQKHIGADLERPAEEDGRLRRRQNDPALVPAYLPDVNAGDASEILLRQLTLLAPRAQPLSESFHRFLRRLFCPS